MNDEEDARALALRDAYGQLVLAALAVRRHIPDGELRNGCHINDGKALRDNLTAAVKAVQTVRDDAMDAYLNRCDST